MNVKHVFKRAIPYMLCMVLYFIVLDSFVIAKVNGCSMQPTYKDGTHLLLLRTKNVSRNDCISIYSQRLGENLCKRVIGLSGDTVKIKGGFVFCNNHKLNESFNQDFTTNMPSLKVGKGQVFILGDNRLNSLDSRELGCLNISDIRGRVLLNIGMDGRRNMVAFCIIIGLCLYLILYIVVPVLLKNKIGVVEGDKGFLLNIFTVYSDITSAVDEKDYVLTRMKFSGVRVVSRFLYFNMYASKDIREYVTGKL